MPTFQRILTTSSFAVGTTITGPLGLAFVVCSCLIDSELGGFLSQKGISILTWQEVFVLHLDTSQVDSLLSMLPHATNCLMKSF